MAIEEMYVALLGLGTVGTGVYKVMKTQEPEMRQKLNTVLRIGKILVRNPKKHESEVDDPSILTSSFQDILDDPRIRIVIEVMGGIEPANTYISEALMAGKSVVTANKDLIAEHGGELLAIAEENQVELRFEASVAGGIPIISPLKNSLSANEISQVMGIVNGTTNYILSKMTDEGMDYKEALQEATELGYQTMQGLYAIASGGLFGRGLGQSIQKMGSIPEAQNDMIFSVICEELGIVGAVGVILVFIFMLWRFKFIAEGAPDRYGSLIVVGIIIHVAVQVIINMSVVTNIIPNTGVTLPFISYGGTSIFFLLIETGLLLAVSRQIEPSGMKKGVDRREA